MPAPNLIADDDHLRRMDAELARLGHVKVRARLRLGEVLLAMGLRFRELGFRTFGMYVRERVSQPLRWCADSKALAKRLAERPAIRAALVGKQISWSKAELLARHSTPEDEAELLEATAASTVREVRDAVTERDEGSEEPEARFRTVDLFVTPTEWMGLEATRLGVEHVNGGASEPGEWLECALFEATSTLLGARPDLVDFFEVGTTPKSAARGEIEEPPPPEMEPPEGAFVDAPLPEDLVALDGLAVELGRQLASQDVWFGELASRFLRARGWARLGYASEQQYCDERLGMSRASVRGRVTLARRCRWLDRLGDAVNTGQVGYEQASLVARVASPDTIDAWLGRARGRTCKHLREEVHAAELLAQIGGEPTTCLAPPTDEELEAVFEAERQVLSGELVANAAAHAGSDEAPVQMSGVSSEARRSRFTVRARDEVIDQLRRLEAAHRASGSEGSFAMFLAVCFWHEWGPLFRVGNRWKPLHDRDRHRCRSPVCTSRNVTNHHLLYRAHGGGDEASNQACLCDFCHLDGEHGGRLKVRGTAERLSWWIGRTPVMEVHGRDVVRR